MVQKRLARWRQCHAVARAVEELGAEAVFHVLDAHARCRERHMRTFGPTREIVHLSDIYEKPKIDQVEMVGHAFPPLCPATRLYIGRSTRAKAEFISFKLLQSAGKIKHSVTVYAGRRVRCDQSRQRARLAGEG